MIVNTHDAPRRRRRRPCCSRASIFVKRKQSIMSTTDKKMISPEAVQLKVLYRDSLDTITKARYLDKLK